MCSVSFDGSAQLYCMYLLFTSCVIHYFMSCVLQYLKSYYLNLIHLCFIISYHVILKIIFKKCPGIDYT